MDTVQDIINNLFYEVDYDSMSQEDKLDCIRRVLHSLNKGNTSQYIKFITILNNEIKRIDRKEKLNKLATL